MFFVAYASLFCITASCIGIFYKYGGFGQERPTNPTFLQFQRPYIVLYTIVVFGDWIQGPYLYKLYHYYGFLESQVAIIYVFGLVSSVLFTPAKEVIADRFGRRNTTVAFAVLYGVSSLIVVIPVYLPLIIGRIIGGVANSFLFGSMEAWYSHEHLETHDFPKEWIPITFGLATFASSIVAVAAGIIADILARWLNFGPPAPYVLATPVLVGAAVTIALKWTENYGPESSKISSKTLKRSLLGAFQALGSKPEVLLVGLIQALFESVIFIFVFIWTPTLSPSSPPLGIVFACFMVSFLLGELLCKQLGHRGITPGTVFLGMSAMGGLSMYIAAYFAAFPQITFLCFLAFELACGVYFPVMADIRARHLPEEHRLSIVSLFRIPLTAISGATIWLYHYDMKGGIREILLFCGVLMTIASLCAIRFTKTVSADSLSEEGKEEVETGKEDQGTREETK